MSISPEATSDSALWRASGMGAARPDGGLVLRYYEDMSEAQIADVFGVGVGSVRNGSWRGLERLRRELSIDTKDQRD